MTLSWPWARRGDATDDNGRAEAHEAKAEADRRLVEARELTPRVNRLAAGMAREGHENHFGERMSAAMKRKGAS